MAQLQCRAGAAGLLCRAGAAGWRSAKPYDRMIRMIRITRRAGVWIASACTRGVIRVPLTVELQLEAQTFPFLPISGP